MDCTALWLNVINYGVFCNFLLMSMFSYMNGAQEELDKTQLQRKYSRILLFSYKVVPDPVA